MESQSGQVLSQLRTSSSAPPSPFPASSCVRASFSRASCFSDVEPRTWVAPGLDPHGHREEMTFLHQIHFEKPPREDLCLVQLEAHVHA